ncbi:MULTISPECIES: DUF4340 domain-containing protein [unclassified Beijerinckia]|uniref:DUF4340 domain-containing protein n=1 Tax=unclassified Beijerinckia TaxID=2638183 RepID=UPI00089D9B29|nr:MULTISPECIES: DUF4340 domain-containing protein [unclassified Beijerinckia]MDH7796870.1 hypothetical protein [Beijerinckia sp. GAS462]SEC63101.1 protein of unknown function [Beijerinckia sp. 28-YEA-48]
MNIKSVTLLGVVTALCVVGSWAALRTAPQGIASDRRTEPVFPQLLTEANNVAAITIRDSDKPFTVERRDNGFFDKASGYPTKPEAFRDIVAGMISLAYEEGKTADPQRYADLGLADAGQAEKSGRQVTLLDSKGATLADIIIGNRDMTVGGARGGTFVRFPKEPQTWLVRGEVRVPVPNTAWFEINLINLNKDALAKLELRGGGLDDVTLVSPTKGADLALAPAPVGRDADNGKLMRLSFMVDPISFQDVRKPTGDVKPGGRTLTAYSHNGLKLTMTSVGDLADGWVRIAAEGTTDDSKKQAEDLKPKLDGFEFKLAKNDSDMLAWGMKDFTQEAKAEQKPPQNDEPKPN